MALSALIVAIVGAVTGIAALAWQVISFRRSGWRLKVEVLSPDPKEAGESRRPGHLYYVIRMTNTGRQAALVSRVMFSAQPETSYDADSIRYVTLHDERSEPLRIEASQQTILDAWIDESKLPAGNIRIHGVAYVGGVYMESDPVLLLVASDWRVRHLRPQAPGAVDGTAVEAGPRVTDSGTIRRKKGLILGSTEAEDYRY